MANILEVYELIQSLNKHEKIQINLYMNSLAGKSKERYIYDYQCFLKQKTYDKESLKKKLNHNIQRKNLSESNTNLYNFILDCLISTHQKKNKKLGLLRDVQGVELLFDKGLINQSSKVLQKVYNDCMGSNNHSLAYYYYDTAQNHLLHQSKTINNYEDRIALVDKQLAFIERSKFILELKKMKRQFFDWAAKQGTPRTVDQRTSLLALMDKNLLSYNTKKIPDSSLSEFYLVRVMMHMSVDPFDKEGIWSLAEEGLSEVRNRIDKTKDIIPEFLLTRLRNQCAVMMNNYETAMQSIQEFEALIPFIDTEQRRILARSNILGTYLQIYRQSRRFEEGLKFLAEYSAEILEKKNNALSPHNYLNHYYAARLCFLANEYESAVEYLDELINKKRIVRASIMSHIYCLYLLCHYKLGNTELMPYITRSIYKNILKARQLYEPEKAILHFLRKTTNAIDIKPEAQKLYDKLQPLKKDMLNHSFFAMGDYLIWLERELDLA